MEAYATLHRAALMILVRYLSLGGENESIDETMEALGLDNLNYFYRCRSQLYKAGLLTRDGKLTLTPPSSSSLEPEPEPEPVSEPVDAGWRYDSSPLSAAFAVDHLDDSGDRNRPGSPFQVRRKAQIQFLQAQFQRLWPEHELIAANAKALLNLAGDSAESVLEAFETASGRDLTGHPFNYIRGILRRQAERIERQQVTVMPTSLEKPEPDYYMEPSPRYKAVLARAAAAGKLKDDEEDEW